MPSRENNWVYCIHSIYKINKVSHNFQFIQSLHWIVQTLVSIDRTETTFRSIHFSMALIEDHSRNYWESIPSICREDKDCAGIAFGRGWFVVLAQSTIPHRRIWRLIRKLAALYVARVDEDLEPRNHWCWTIPKQIGSLQIRLGFETQPLLKTNVQWWSLSCVAGDSENARWVMK